MSRSEKSWTRLVRFEQWLENNGGPQTFRGWLNDRYGAWICLQVTVWTDTTRWDALSCLLRGHRDVIEIPHREICEQYWDDAHTAKTSHIIERICRRCDSGYLSSRRG